MSVRVAVLMSGGVDSSVALLCLIREGHDCEGLSLLFHDDSTCCRQEDIADAGAMARALGVRHEILNLREVFKKSVVEPFIQSYAAGLTPNPCALCNRDVKFGRALEWATDNGFDAIASGHYARLSLVQGEVILRSAADRAKSQEYFLALVPGKNLAKALFPLGEMTKARVRELARDAGLPVSEKPESQDACFIRGDLAGFLCREIGPRPGRFLDHEGRVLGRHEAAYSLTVGQRKGHGVAAGARAYVVGRRGDDVLLGTREEALSGSLWMGEVNRLGPVAVGQSYTLRIRLGHDGADAVLLENHGDRMAFEFAEPQFAITPGQLAVAYEGDRVVAGGIIDRAG